MIFYDTARGPMVFVQPERQRISDSTPKTLYVSRPVTNASAILAHYRKAGVSGLTKASELHVTIAFSRVPVDWMKVGQTWQETITIPAGGARVHEMLGSNADVFVLMFPPDELSWRHEQIKEAGATWDWPSYEPHISLSYSAVDFDPESVKPYVGRIDLGAEVFAEVNENWKEKATS